ncbi:UDP-N-acetylglucosamine 2-epimerase (non-hydrolyzing) [Leclercia sp. 29361]|uniref:non-hydrolyzing UDP-N-acetylglucosamine 2-epimerase n=1 Tax=Leclercia sp. 29361 TaxID=2714951 RepID=UPI00140A1F44|nr:UDP-N-acetylglucosamine 2-epimerase (non-hydrolyzing) [Leclercia sp. 29361]QIK14589.1 UDP-N-acetylglucosamine 2-epimerase (non-hydrolyzing) [Leclercia sp. 29361]
MSKKILLVFGTRPEAIKMIPLIKKIQNDVRFDYKVCVTAQHREMLDQVLSIFSITPDYDLNLMKRGQQLVDLTASMIISFSEVLQNYKPDYVLVHGDTSTTLACTIASYYNQIKVGHVEAGLRTGNLLSPWPEEGNRKVAGALASIHFAPTETSRSNLLKENVPDDSIFVTGNTVVDTLFLAKELIKADLGFQQGIHSKYNFLQNDKRLVLITGHRRESFGKGFENICEGIKDVARQFPDTNFVYPVHLNPQVQEPVNRLLSSEPNIFLIQPLDYLPFVYFMDRSYFILTDSGGVQEEAPSLGKPVLVMRDTTERPEAVEAGTVRLVGTSREAIFSGMKKLLDDAVFYSEMSHAHNPYGDGNAAERILDALANAH